MKLQMVDLKSQYLRLKTEIDEAIIETVGSTAYINGPKVKAFKADLESYLNVRHVIPCANGTDALQIAMMALGLKPGDEVIVPAFTYVATAEVISLLKLKPVMVDVDPQTFNLTVEIFEKAITPKTKAVVPVHLFGQSTDMEAILNLAKERGIFVIEDTAQATGAEYTFSDGSKKMAGTMGDVGTTSFFPSKNLGCFGDGGAMFTNDDELASKLKMVSNHGQSKRYYHDVIGVNSRLDSIQAAILSIKLKHLDEFNSARQMVASNYDTAFQGIDALTKPHRSDRSTHIFHQYTLKVANKKRDELIAYLKEKEIPCNIYYPVPLYEQKAFSSEGDAVDFLPITDQLCKEVMSLPIHTEMTDVQQNHIIQNVLSFFE